MHPFTDVDICKLWQIHQTFIPSSCGTPEHILEALKDERTQIKTKVTLAARRLKGAIKRRADFSCISTFLTELQRAYGDFELYHDDHETELTNQPHLAEQYGTVNGKNLVDYKLVFL